VALQKEHHVLDGFLRRPGALDHRHAAFANARDLNQSFALFFDNGQRFQSEVRDNALRRHRADAFDQAAAQVFFQAGQGGRLRFLRRDDLELLALSVPW